MNNLHLFLIQRFPNHVGAVVAYSIGYRPRNMIVAVEVLSWHLHHNPQIVGVVVGAVVAMPANQHPNSQISVSWHEK